MRQRAWPGKFLAPPDLSTRLCGKCSGEVRPRGDAQGLGAKWCGRPGSNRHRPRGPTDFHTRYGFRRPILRGWAPDGFGVWTIPSP